MMSAPTPAMTDTCAQPDALPRRQRARADRVPAVLSPTYPIRIPQEIGWEEALVESLADWSEDDRLIAALGEQDRPRWIRVALPKGPTGGHGGRRRSLVSWDDEVRMLSAWEALARAGQTLSTDHLRDDLQRAAGHSVPARSVRNLLRRHGYRWVGKQPPWRRLARRQADDARHDAEGFAERRAQARDQQRRSRRKSTVSSADPDPVAAPERTQDDPQGRIGDDVLSRLQRDARLRYGVDWRARVVDQQALARKSPDDVPSTHPACVHRLWADPAVRRLEAAREGRCSDQDRADLEEADLLADEVRSGAPRVCPVLLLEALLICGWSPEAIAARLDRTPGTIHWYQEAHFDVGPALGKPAVFYELLVPRAFDVFRGRDTQREWIHYLAYQARDGDVIWSLLCGREATTHLLNFMRRFREWELMKRAFMGVPDEEADLRNRVSHRAYLQSLLNLGKRSGSR